MIVFHDISQWQGAYNMADGNPLIAIKMSGGDAGLYYDTKASLNYANAIKAGKAVIGYHFAGGGDPIAEADFFIRAMSPLAEGDILALDWEVHPAGKDPVQWCLSFVNHIHDKTGVWPLIYMNTSTCTSHDWSPVLKNCGLWIADYRFNPSQTVPCGHPYIIHQYCGSPLDTNALFIDLPTLKKYGYHPPKPAPAPAPIATIPAPPVIGSATGVPTVPGGVLSPQPKPDSPELTLAKENNSLLKQILAIMQGIAAKLAQIFK